MKTILHVDASVRGVPEKNTQHSSISKTIARKFVTGWRKYRPVDEYIYRDVGMSPPEFITQQWIAAVFTSEGKKTAEQRRLLAQSDEMIAEVCKADVIVISTPMYNYGMPAQLKAWFDQIIRINKTFDFDLARGDFPLEPLLSGKTLILITSCGEFGFGVGEIRENMGHLLPHLRTLGRYLGAQDIYEIGAEYQEFGDIRHRDSVAKALHEADVLAEKLTGSMHTTSGLCGAF